MLDELAELARGRRVVALTGAGCSTESGIPDYRGPGARPRTPLQHREFVEKSEARRRYWARSTVGWPRFRAARPNAAHAALTALERAGALAGIITQNVDSLHGKAGSRAVVELHGALARVRCLACERISDRDELQARLLAANPGWAGHSAEVAPDGDVELAAAHVDRDSATLRVAARPGEAGACDRFELVACSTCAGVLMPDVVFFGGSVPRATLDAAWALFERAELLLVVGSSLAVFSGYRFVKRAADCGVPIAIVNHGPTRGDAHAALRVDARCGDALPRLASLLA